MQNIDIGTKLFSPVLRAFRVSCELSSHSLRFHILLKTDNDTHSMDYVFRVFMILLNTPHIRYNFTFFQILTMIRIL
jgi:hypothetical protein